MRRRLLNLVTVLSLLLCAGVCGMWVRSYAHRDLVGRRTVAPPRGAWVDEQFRGVVSAGGGVAALSTKRRASVDHAPPPSGGRFTWRVDPDGWETAYSTLSDPLLGFESSYKSKWGSDRTLFSDEWRWIRVPYWAIVTLTAALPLYRLWATLRRRARPTGDTQPPG